MLECVCELPVKTRVYCTLVALVNASRPEAVGWLLGRAQAALARALALGPLEAHRARILVRFLVACASVRCVSGESALALLQSLLAAAQAEAGHPATQPRADALAYYAMAALPFAGGELAEGEPEAMAALVASCESFLAARAVRGSVPSLRPLSGLGPGEDAAEAGEDYVTELWGRLAACAAGGSWEPHNLRLTRVHSPFKAELQHSQPHALPPLTVPPLLQPLRASSRAAGLGLFPPRPRLRLLDPGLTERFVVPGSGEGEGGCTAAAQRFAAEELLLDTLWAWEDGASYGKLHKAAEMLAGGMPFEGHTALLAETLYSSALQLPSPPFRPVYYSAVLGDLCKAEAWASAPADGATFPTQGVGKCVGTAFRRLAPSGEAGPPELHPAAAEALCELLALHLSSTQLGWPWANWAHAAGRPAWHPQRRFVAELLAKLVRLCYHERVASVLPDGPMRALLGPPPAPDAGWPPPGPPAAAALAQRLLALAQAKAAESEMRSALAAAVVESGGGVGARDALRALAATLSHHGRKSITHTAVLIGRYAATLAAAAEAAGGEEAGGAALLGAYAERSARCGLVQGVWLACEQLQAAGLLSTRAVLAWAFGPEGAPLRQGRLGSAGGCRALWITLEGAVERERAALIALPTAAARASAVEAADAAESLGAASDAAAAAQAGDDWTEREMATQAEQMAAAVADAAEERAAYALSALRDGEARFSELLQMVAAAFAAACDEAGARCAAAGEAGEEEEALAAHWCAHDAFRVFAARRYSDAGEHEPAVSALLAGAAAPQPPRLAATAPA